MPAVRTEDGRVVMVARKGDRGDRHLTLACGQCQGCRLERSRVWAVRCMHEAMFHERTCFLTLTYEDSNLPRLGSLQKEDFQTFVKTIRDRERYQARKDGREPQKLRYFHCGEYGDKYGRPHYHAAIYGFDWAESRKLAAVDRGYQYFESEEVQSAWSKGKHRISDLTFKSAAYVARYIMKKVNGTLAEDHYAASYTVDKSTGEVKVDELLEPEYTTMSRRPGIGKKYFDKYKHEIYRDDFIVMNGKKFRPPKFYDGQYELEDKQAMELVKDQRESKGERHKANNTRARLKVRQTIQDRKAKQLKRDIEQ